MIAEIDHCLHNGLCTVAKLDRCLVAEWNQCSIADPTDAILFKHKTTRRAMFGHTTLFAGIKQMHWYLHVSLTFMCVQTYC